MAIVIKIERQFNKCFKKLNKELKAKVIKKLELFKENPSHPSLRNKLIKKTKDDIPKCYEISVDMNYRMIYYIEDEIYNFIDILDHRKFERKY